MKRFLIPLTIALVVFATACGDDAETDVGDDTLPDDTLPGDTVPGDTLPDDTAPDGPIGAGPYPIADLSVRVTPTEDGDTTEYRLACLGDTATLTGDPAPTDAATMCLALQDSDLRGRLLDGEPTDQACTEIYGGPEVATVRGTLDGDEVDTSFHRSNGCGIADWDLFDDLLPPAS